MWLEFFRKEIDIIRGKIHTLYDITRSKFISDKYIIIPLGCFCLPRVITTFCYLKKKRLFGEKTYPFDLAFFNDFDANISLVENHFKNFYDDLEFDDDKLQYENKKLNSIFNHDGNLTFEEFKERYDKRIENFYTDIGKENKKIYFIWSSFYLIKEEQVNNLINIIKKFRSDKFKIILLYCNIRNTISYNSDYVSVIDKIDIASINTSGDWANELSKRNSKQSRKVYNSLNRKLRRIIK